MPVNPERKLVAIFAADVEGYSRLMSTDEVGAMQSLTQRRAILDGLITSHRGRIANTAGDSVLAEFGSAVDAVRCAVEAQAALGRANEGVPSDSQINFRIGVHVGDVMVKDGDLFGDGVNIAARLQTLARAGDICLSGAAYDQVRKLVLLDFVDLGAQQVKNMEEPIRVYSVSAASSGNNSPIPVSLVSSAATSFEHNKPLALPDKPSIAVLPFQYMSSDPDHEYFADGIAEDVLTTLSKIQELVVIARQSSFVFKGQAKDIREIGRILGARYVLEGSVRKVGNRVRLTAQLIDGLDGSHMWADRFDGDLDDVFDLQDRITQEIVAALEVRLALGEEARVWRKRSGSPLVYEHYLKSRSLYLNFAKHTHAQARDELERALKINPDFTPALVLLGYALTDQARFGWVKDRAATYEAALDCATRALAADPDCGEAYTVIGYVRTFQRRHDEAVVAGEKAITLSPSGATAHHMAGMSHGYAGNFREAALYEELAQRLSPIESSVSMIDEARARFHLGDFIAARDIASRVLKQKPQWLTAQSTLVAALWNLGSEDEARIVANELLARHPDFSVARWAHGLPYRHQEHLDALIKPLQLAGLPD